MKTKTRYSPLVKMIEGLSKCLDAESAKHVLKYRVDAKLQKHLDEFAHKCTEGTLTPYESSEYGYCIALGDFVDMLKSKIRTRLANDGE